MTKGIFIVLDGLDGSGKSTLANLLCSYITFKGTEYDVLITREPTNGIYGKQIRAILANEKEPKSNAEKMLDMFVMDREEHLKKQIIPFLKKNDGKKNIVICDRYYYSTIAFQSTQGLDIEMVIGKNKKLIKPDIAFIMDIKPEIAMDRIKNRQKEKFESLEFMKKLRERFLELPKILKDKIKVINASRKREEVFEEIKKDVDKLLV